MQISLDLPQKSLVIFYFISKCIFTKVLPEFLEPWYRINFCYLPFAVFAEVVLVGWSKRLKQIIEIKRDGVKNPTSWLFITVTVVEDLNLAGVTENITPASGQEVLPEGAGSPMLPVWILKCLVSLFINACRLLSALPSLSQFGQGRLSLVVVSFYALPLLFGPCRLSEFTLAGPRSGQGSNSGPLTCKSSTLTAGPRCLLYKPIYIMK